MPNYAAEPKLPLTRMENKVLQYILCGMSSQEAANLLHVSKRTVDWHLYFAYRKLGVSNRIAALRRAAELKALRPLDEQDREALKAYEPSWQDVTFSGVSSTA